MRKCLSTTISFWGGIVLLIICLILIAMSCPGCATLCPKPERQQIEQLNLSIQTLEFYTTILYECGEAIDILADEKLPVDLRIWLYDREMKVIKEKIDQFNEQRKK